MAAVAGFYRRTLPSPPAIEFSSPEGKQLFKEALENGHTEGFFKLISYYQTQSEPAYCGLASLALVLNALAIDPGRKWKGPWRWFDDTMLDCCEPLEKIKVQGISFSKVVCLAYCNGAKVDSFHTNESTLDNFRNYVISCTSSEDYHMIVSYNRQYLKQTGTGHFSPIGGYHIGKDMVLILDVARFKYPPHWVPLTLLWEAMDTIDPATGHHRGFMTISRLSSGTSVLYTVCCHHVSWKATAKYLTKEVPQLFSVEKTKDLQELLAVLFAYAPADLRDFINWVAEVRRQEDGNISEEEKGRLAIKEEVLNQVQETELYELVTRWLASESCCKYIKPPGKDSLNEIAAKVCCQGAQVLLGKVVNSSDRTSCRVESSLVMDNGDKPVTVISGKLITESAEGGVDILVPSCRMKLDGFCGCESSNLNRKHPSIDDVFTVLLLALPPHTWSGIKDEQLREQIHNLVSTDSLPTLLQEEVLHLRQQLHYVSVGLCDSSS
ncbi:Glutathione gamma-glutamylcysteinyltransferase 3 [Ancistrocladus abbreviatus]